ncbi:MAG: hypothetical protein ABIJ86_10820 [Spirochaetota bacterium]
MDEIRNETYFCPLVNHEVTITRKIKLHRSGRHGGVDAEFTAGLSCDHDRECPVAITSGASITFERSKCPHPELKE